MEHDNFSFLMPVYSKRIPVSFTRGQGVWLWDDSSDLPYLDALSGRGVSSLGHARREVTQSIVAQTSQLIHTSNLYHIPQQEELAATLCKRFDMKQAFFANSAAESIEATIKIVCRHATVHSIKAPVIITLEGSYHGRTLGALALSQSKDLKQEEKRILNTLSPTIIKIPFNDVKALASIFLKYSARIAGVFIEPILGHGGIKVCSTAYLTKLWELSKRHNCLIVADEAQTGLCRTGPWSACEHAKLTPDVIVLAKALGNGFPISAYLVNEKASNLLNQCHGCTFAGSPLASTIGLTVLKVLEEIQPSVHKKAVYFKTRLKQSLSPFSMIREIRGKGLMLGIELNHNCQSFVQVALFHRLLVDVVNESTIRLLPPLVITNAEIDNLIERLVSSLAHYAQVSGTKKKRY